MQSRRQSVAAFPAQAATAIGVAVTHDIRGAGRIYSAAVGADNRRYYSDESRHRVVVEEPNGHRWEFGTPGSGPGEFRHPRGLAALPGPTHAITRVFVCDAWNHRVQVFDGNGQFLLAFGARGDGEGQFDVPSDVTLVYPEFPGEQGDDGSAELAWLAVADRWNNRVQILDLDGTFIRSLGGTAVQPDPAARRWSSSVATGWPYFQIGIDPATWFPARVAWRAPYLQITSANQRVLNVHLALALLPDFDEWRSRAPVTELVAAHRAFRSSRNTGGRLPPDVLAALARAVEQGMAKGA